MHRLSEVTIKNFKSIEDLTLELTNYTPLVGYNNAGKSNILQAIDWFLKPSKLYDSDFYDGREGEGLVVKGKIEGLDDTILDRLVEKHRDRITEYLEDERIFIRRSMDEPGNASTADLEIWSPEDDEWINNPTGIDNAVKALFPEPIFMKAMEDAYEDIGKSKRSNTIGKLLAEITKPIVENNEELIEETLGQIKNMFSADGNERVDELQEIDEEFDNVVNNFFPGINLKVHVPPPTVDDLFKSGTVQISEGENGLNRDFESMGHGAQRSIQMALVKYLSERQTSDDESNSRKFLLIEEPELYLHPQAITYLSSALKKLSKGGYQIVFATHSPIMISQNDVGVTALIRKSEDAGTYRHNTLNEALDEVAADMGITDTLFNLDNSSQILFADEVVLIEGKTERKLVPKIFESHYDLSEFQTKVGFIDIGGAPAVGNATTILENMGINPKVLVDLDYCFNSSVDHGYIEDENDIYQEGIEIIRNKVEEFGIDIPDGWPDTGKLSAEIYTKVVNNSERFREIVRELHKILKDQNVWIWQEGPIEIPLGIDSKKPKAHEVFINDLYKDGLQETVAEYDSVTDFFDWLLK
ncbi:ATP-dependent nuclease [Halalkalibaculum sp. DA384]|uniref:ATP-dependent nuclease n=1 Tax=Halalkalibaculum sp. DA384 TaxID=3373606 RepID=UPI0037549D19